VKVAVIMGGASAEKDVSIKTGEAVVKACLANNFDVSPIVFDNNYKDYFQLLKEVDIVFNALHGAFGEDGTIQKWLEQNNILFTGSDSIASKVCMNKIESKKIVYDNDILTPEWVKMRKNINLSSLSYPCIVKPNSQGSTFGLSYLENSDLLTEAIDHGFAFDSEVLIEEYISGREITVGVLGNEVLPIVEILPKHKLYDYECKYTPGMTNYECPVKLDKGLKEKINNDTIKIFELLGCRGYGRVDYIIDKNNNHYFLELNTLPGMTSTSLLPIAAKNAGMSFDDLIRKIIHLGIYY
jgi:D-alanine-D-alanine ligase